MTEFNELCILSIEATWSARYVPNFTVELDPGGVPTIAPRTGLRLTPAAELPAGLGFFGTFGIFGILFATVFALALIRSQNS